jgi:hypothetical protein
MIASPSFPVRSCVPRRESCSVPQGPWQPTAVYRPVDTGPLTDLDLGRIGRHEKTDVDRLNFQSHKPCSTTFDSHLPSIRDLHKRLQDFRTRNGHEPASGMGDRACALPSLGASAQYIAPESNLHSSPLSRPSDATRVSANSLPFQEITPPGLFS